MSYNVKIENNVNRFKADYKQKKMKMTYALGLKWLEIATKLITSNGIVDTGRLRASLSFITPYKSSGENQFATKSNESKATDRLRGKTDEKNTVIVGSNVSYAKQQELNNPKGAFIKPAVTGFRQDYENVIKAIMKE